MTEARALPLILLISEEHADFLADEFGRYRRDYDVRAVHSVAEAKGVLDEVRSAGGQVPLVVAESVLPDSDLYQAFGKLRAVVPTARRMVVAHVDRFLDDAPRLRPGLAKGKYDAFLMMPRGARDEEHDATPRGWAETSVEITHNQACAAVAEYLAGIGG